MARSIITHTSLKECQRCNTIKPFNEFHKDRKIKDGHSNWCKSCSYEYNKEYLQRPDIKKRTAEYKRKYQIDNKDDIAKAKKKYYQDHKEEIAEYNKERSQRPDIKRQRRKYIDRNKERIALRHKEYILTKNYGITLEERNEIINEQDGKCAICRKELDYDKNTHVDHDHETGMARGILCYHCNMAIGLLMDDPEIARLATEYLIKYKEVKNGT